MVNAYATVHIAEGFLVEMQVALALVVEVEAEAGAVLEASHLTSVFRDNAHLLDPVVRELVFKFQEASARSCMGTECQSGFQKTGRGLCL